MMSDTLDTGSGSIYKVMLSPYDYMMHIQIDTCNELNRLGIDGTITSMEGGERNMSQDRVNTTWHVSATNMPVLEQSTYYYRVHIDKVSNGFVVKVGCKTFVAETWNKVSKALQEYWDDPAKAEKKYVK